MCENSSERPNVFVLQMSLESETTILFGLLHEAFGISVSYCKQPFKTAFKKVLSHFSDNMCYLTLALYRMLFLEKIYWPSGPVSIITKV